MPGQGDAREDAREKRNLILGSCVAKAHRARRSTVMSSGGKGNSSGVWTRGRLWWLGVHRGTGGPV
jgi:hypothetical protein